MAQRPELIFGLVGPAGVRLDDLSQELMDQLSGYGYQSTLIRVSELLERFLGFTPPEKEGEAARIRHRQAMGNAFRNAMDDGAALALASMVKIREQRRAMQNDPNAPIPSHAYILHQFKHPAEVELLRQVYGPAFFLVAGHAPRPTRVKELADRLAKKADQPGQASKFSGDAEQIITDDEKQDDDLGQNTRDTYPKADLFVNLGLPGGEKESVLRFVQLIFRHPFRTPSQEEFAMYQAHSISLRSSDFSRQVGAAIAETTFDAARRVTNVDVLALGMNEVPRGGGGSYWDGDSPDLRDQALRKSDRAKEIKIGALVELIDKFKSEKWFSDPMNKEGSGDLARKILPSLKKTQFMDIGEFMRPVHAEMAALIDAARRGVEVSGRTMYVTTFPCHNCAKHIIAAGLRKVVYLEPYPKSRAGFLHGEEISLDSINGAEENGKVVFAAFAGIAPRQYSRLFSISDRGRTPDRSLENWEKNRLSLEPHQFYNAAAAYVKSERDSLKRLDPKSFNWDPSSIG